MLGTVLLIMLILLLLLLGYLQAGEANSGRYVNATPSDGARVMNEDTLKGNWKQLKGKAKEKWGKLTDDQLMQTRGEWEQLIGAVQTAYGRTRDEAEREVEEFRSACEC